VVGVDGVVGLLLDGVFDGKGLVQPGKEIVKQV